MSDYKCGFDAHSQQDRAFGGGHPDPAAMLTTELRDELKAVAAERDRLAGEVATLTEKNEALAEDLKRWKREVTIAVSDRDAAVTERDRLKVIGQKLLAKSDDPTASVTQWDVDELRAAIEGTP